MDGNLKTTLCKMVLICSFPSILSDQFFSDEHYRRSTECSFFHFALAAGKKGKSGRKNSRSSKASRISTQSNISTLSETVTPDLENEMDYSLLSQATSEPPNTSTKPKAKGRKAKAKKETPAENSVLVEGEELAEVAEAAPVKKPRGRKRKSDEILEHDTLQGNISSDHEPAPKRRPTASRKICTATAVVITDSTNDTLDDTVESTKTKKQPKRKPAKKRSTSTNRGSSNTAKALKSQIPNDAEIEAQLEADLERDEEVAQTASPVVSSKPSRNAKRTSRASEANEPDEHATAISKKSGRKTEKKSSKKKVSIENDVEVTLDRSNPDNEHSENDASMGLDHAEEKIQGDPEIQPTANTHNPPKPSKKSKTSNQRTSHERNASTEKGDSVGTLVNRGSSNPNKTIRRSQTIFDEITISRASIKLDGPRQSAATQGQVVSLDRGVSGDVEAKGRRSRTGSHPHLANEDIFSQESTPSPVKPRTQPQPRALPQAQERTPSPSPQSSDAENRPPSARPPLNPNEASSIKSAGIGLPQSPKTPAASVQRGFGETIISTPSAWNPVDLDDLLQSDYANKENVDFNDMLQAAKCDLTSPEKRMTVEEWIAWNAKKGETKLRNECEKLVSVFEREGGRAMQVLEEIECID